MSIDLYDAIHANVSHIPAGARKVMGYTSGTPDIQWIAIDWQQFPDAGHVRIEQGYGGLSDAQILGCDEFDVERGAITPAQIPAAVHLRISKGIHWTTIYAGDANLAAVRAELIKAETQYGRHWFFGHVDCHLANWNLTRTQAAAMLGHEIHGLTCRAVQFTNDGTYDTSVTQDNWHAYHAPITEIRQLAQLAHGEVLTAKTAIGTAIGKLNELLSVLG